MAMARKLGTNNVNTKNMEDDRSGDSYHGILGAQMVLLFKPRR